MFRQTKSTNCSHAAGYGGCPEIDYIVSEIYTSCSLRHEDFSIFYMYHLYKIKYIIVLYRGGSYKIVKKLRDEPLWFTML